MRHRKARTKFKRTAPHRRAMFSNMLLSLLEHGRIQTTERKARELRRVAERTVTRATRLGDVLLKDPGKLDAEDRARLVHAMRQVRRTLRDRDAVMRLFDEWAPRYLGRPGGYTRIYKLGARRGDGAPMAQIEFVDAEMPEREGRADDGGSDEQSGKSKKGLFGLGRKKSS